MNYYKYDIVFQEVPGEISLAFYMTGCSCHCKGCHSPELWNPKNGSALTIETFDSLIQRYQGNLSCVLFMGGEWEVNSLIKFAERAKAYQLKTALYTGREFEDLPATLIQTLDYLKTGPWRENLGGLDSPKTNQKFYDLKHYKEAVCL
jgi:anaerobic ribonucleoside-triphosphate reductase activating protein